MRTSNGTEGIFAVCRAHCRADSVHGVEVKRNETPAENVSLQGEMSRSSEAAISVCSSTSSH